MILPSGEAEAFHLIRAHMRYFNVDRELRTLMVASAAPGDGKTTIARHLAGAAARVGSRVLLLEADLRRPTLAQQMGVQSGPGLADVLIGAVPLAEATQTIELGSPSGESAKGRTFDVLVAGAALPPNPHELIESHAMETLLERVKSAYDLVVIDTPPFAPYSYSYAYDYSYQSAPPSGSGAPSGEADAAESSPNGAVSSDAPVPTSQT